MSLQHRSATPMLTSPSDVRRRSSKIALAGALGIAMLSPLLATSAMAQTTTTAAGEVPSTTIAAAADTAAPTDTTAGDTAGDTIAPDPVGGVNAGFGGAADNGDSSPVAPIVVLAAGATGAGFWLMRRRSHRRLPR